MSHLKHIYIAKMVVETTSPMAINSGQRETGFDAELVRDASGLPIIPATAIAGVWSHVFEHIISDKDGDSAAKELKIRWFGDTNQSSSLTINNGYVHDSHNRPVKALLTPDEIAGDSLLRLLASPAPLHRERVSLNDRGVAKDTGKFDQVLLPTGTRFSITVRFDDRPRNDKQSLCLDGQQGFEALLQAWFDPRFAFGSSTRNGLGQIKIIAGELSCVDLSKGIKANTEIQSALAKQPDTLNSVFVNRQQAKLLASLPLQALDNWRCGTGSDLLADSAVAKSQEKDSAKVTAKVAAKVSSKKSKVARVTSKVSVRRTEPEFDKPDAPANIHSLSYSEKMIEWNGIKAGSQSTVSKPKAILCGSSIKGILAHRIAFHYRKHEKIWAESMADCSHKEWETRPKELKELLGWADEDDHKNSAAGKLWVSDCELEFEHTVVRTHNQIDRFTGGVRKGALFTEELLYQPRFTLKLLLDPSATLSESLGQALKDTINDLQLGLLPMGAGSGRGNSLVLATDYNDNSWSVNFDDLQGDVA